MIRGFSEAQGDIKLNIKTELYNDNFQNFKRYNIPKANLVVADIPYNLGANAYARNTEWYIDGDNRNGGRIYAFLQQVIN